MGIIDLLAIIWADFSKVLPPIALVFFLLMIWCEIRSYLTRKRVACILDAKDVTIKDLTDKTLNAVSGYSRLTGLLEKLLEEMK